VTAVEGSHTASPDDSHIILGPSWKSEALTCWRKPDLSHSRL